MTLAAIASRRSPGRRDAVVTGDGTGGIAIVIRIKGGFRFIIRGCGLVTVNPRPVVIELRNTLQTRTGLGLRSESYPLEDDIDGTVDVVFGVKDRHRIVPLQAATIVVAIRARGTARVIPILNRIEVTGQAVDNRRSGPVTVRTGDTNAEVTDITGNVTGSTAVDTLDSAITIVAIIGVDTDFVDTVSAGYRRVAVALGTAVAGEDSTPGRNRRRCAALAIAVTGVTAALSGTRIIVVNRRLQLIGTAVEVIGNRGRVTLTTTKVVGVTVGVIGGAAIVAWRAAGIDVSAV